MAPLWGHKRDISKCPINVRFTPESGHSSVHLECPLCVRHGRKFILVGRIAVVGGRIALIAMLVAILSKRSRLILRSNERMLAEIDWCIWFDIPPYRVAFMP